jgi:hypothetical protein
MKKVLFIVILCTGFFTAGNAQVSFGIHANGLITGGKVEQFDISADHKSRFSWKFGTVADVTISENFGFMPQLNILNKGGNLSVKWYDGEFDVQTMSRPRLTYIELPLNLVYRSDGFFGGVGPVFSFGMGGKSNDTDIFSQGGVVKNREETRYDVKFDGKKNGSETGDILHFKSFEFGANAIAGYTFNNGLFAQASFNLGISNIIADDRTSWKNNYFSVGVGYFFNKKSK